MFFLHYFAGRHDLNSPHKTIADGFSLNLNLVVAIGRENLFSMEREEQSAFGKFISRLIDALEFPTISGRPSE